MSATRLVITYLKKAKLELKDNPSLSLQSQWKNITKQNC